MLWRSRVGSEESEWCSDLRDVSGWWGIRVRKASISALIGYVA